MKRLWTTSVITLATATLLSTFASPPPDLSSHELFKCTVGFESRPMSEMMQALAPESPELWHEYSDCVGNLLLANLYLNTDVQKITKAVYDLRFHEEMTRSCISNTSVLSLLSADSYLSSDPYMIFELLNIADLMNDALYVDQACNCSVGSCQDYFMSLMRFKCLGIADTSIGILPLFQLPELKVAEIMQAQEASFLHLGELSPLYCQDALGTFAPKDGGVIQWADLDHVLNTKEAFEYDNRLFQYAADDNPDTTLQSFIQDHFASYFSLPTFSQTLTFEKEHTCSYSDKRPTYDHSDGQAFFFENPNYVSYETSK